jgi:hypothetical protein
MRGGVVTAEEIVRALATAYPPNELVYAGSICTLCTALNALEPKDHKPSCQWRLAREWVAEHPL